MCFRHCKQDDFANQIYVLESMIWEAGHEYIFLPKFQCELNPIEMVRKSKISSLINLFYVIYFYSIGDGLNIGTDRLRQVDKIQYLPTSQRCRLRGPRFMSSQSDTAIQLVFRSPVWSGLCPKI